MRVWDAVTGEQRTLLTGHDGWVTAVAMAPDGTWLATTDQIVLCVSGKQPPVKSGRSCGWIAG